MSGMALNGLPNFGAGFAKKSPGETMGVDALQSKLAFADALEFPDHGNPAKTSAFAIQEALPSAVSGLGRPLAKIAGLIEADISRLAAATALQADTGDLPKTAGTVAAPKGLPSTAGLDASVSSAQSSAPKFAPQTIVSIDSISMRQDGGSDIKLVPTQGLVRNNAAPVTLPAGLQLFPGTEIPAAQPLVQVASLSAGLSAPHSLDVGVEPKPPVSAAGLDILTTSERPHDAAPLSSVSVEQALGDLSSAGHAFAELPPRNRISIGAQVLSNPTTASVTPPMDKIDSQAKTEFGPAPEDAKMLPLPATEVSPGPTPPPEHQPQIVLVKTIVPDPDGVAEKILVNPKNPVAMPFASASQSGAHAVPLESPDIAARPNALPSAKALEALDAFDHPDQAAAYSVTSVERNMSTLNSAGRASVDAASVSKQSAPGAARQIGPADLAPAFDEALIVPAVSTTTKADPEGSAPQIPLRMEATPRMFTPKPLGDRQVGTPRTPAAPAGNSILETIESPAASNPQAVQISGGASISAAPQATISTIPVVTPVAGTIPGFGSAPADSVAPESTIRKGPRPEDAAVFIPFAAVNIEQARPRAPSDATDAASRPVPQASSGEVTPAFAESDTTSLAPRAETLRSGAAALPAPETPAPSATKPETAPINSGDAAVDAPLHAGDSGDASSASEPQPKATVLERPAPVAPAQALSPPAAAVVDRIANDRNWAAHIRPSTDAGQSLAAAPAPVTDLKIQLNPIELGAVTAKLKIESGVLTVEIEVESAEAFNRLTSDRETIERALRAVGVDVGDVTIRQSQAAQNNGAAHQNPTNGQRDGQGFSQQNQQSGQNGPQNSGMSGGNGGSGSQDDRGPNSGQSHGDVDGRNQSRAAGGSARGSVYI